MKKSIVALGCMIAFLTSPARAGKETGNGGDQIALEFISKARVLVRYLAQNSDLQELLAPVTSDLLLSTIDRTTVETRDELFLQDGREVNAINQPESGRILVSRSRWPNTSRNTNRMMSLVFHEYLGLMHISDEHYQLSSKLEGWFEKTGVADRPDPGGPPTCDFEAFSLKPGQVTMANVGMLDEFFGKARALRFYWSDRSFDDITLSSKFVQSFLSADGWAWNPFVLGGLESGRRYFFKMGVVDQDGELLFFTPDRENDFLTHSVVVK